MTSKHSISAIGMRLKAIFVAALFDPSEGQKRSLSQEGKPARRFACKAINVLLIVPLH